MRDKIEKIPWDAVLFLLLLAVMPHILITSRIIDFKIFGKSAWLGLTVAGLVACALIAAAKSKKLDYILLLSTSTVIFLTVVLVRAEVYDLNVISELLYARPLILIPFSLILALHYCADRNVAKFAFWIMFLTGLSQAAIGIMHYFVFPEIVTGAFAWKAGKVFYVDSINWRAAFSRESGTLGNPSAYAEFICVSTYLLCKSRINLEKFPAAVYYVVQGVLSAVLGCGILLSLSRLHVVFASIFIFLNLAAVAPVLLLLAPVVILLMASEYSHLISRFRLGDLGGRAAQNELAISAYVSSLKMFVIGIPVEIYRALRTIEGDEVTSDNSYLALAMNSGIIIAAWFANMVLFFSRYWKNRRAADVVFVAYLLISHWVAAPYTHDGWNLFCMTALVLPRCQIREDEK